MSGGYNAFELVGLGSRHIALYNENNPRGTYFVHPNALGSDSNWTDWKGATNGEEIYAPWGQKLVAGGYVDRFAGMSHRDQTGFDVTPNRDYSFNLGRWLTPDPVGGHLEDPQTLNKYAYVRNNPTSLTDPSGLDFNLACKGESDTCHGGQVGQYVTNDGNASFQATVVTSASLSDPQSGNTATVTENGVMIATAQGTFQGVFINKTPAADIQGSGKLQDFSFHVDSSNKEKGTLDAGTFTFHGTRDETRKTLDQRGAFRTVLDKRFLFGRSADELVFHGNSSQHRFGQGPSPHLSVPDDPRDAVPTVGPFHVDRDVGVRHAACAWFGVGCE